MRRVTVKAFGGPEQLMTGQHPTEYVPPQGSCSSTWRPRRELSRCLRSARHFQSRAALPPGLREWDRVREIGEEIGSDTERLAPGRRVAWINVPGSYAEQVVVPAAQAYRSADSFTAVQALLFQAITAQYLITEYRTLRPRDRVLVTQRREAWQLCPMGQAPWSMGRRTPPAREARQRARGGADA